MVLSEDVYAGQSALGTHLCGKRSGSGMESIPTSDSVLQMQSELIYWVSKL